MAQGLAMPLLGVGAESARLALAFVTAAVAVGIRGRGWPSSVAAGGLLAAGVVTTSGTALMALVLAGLAAPAAGGAARRRLSAERSRLGLALGVTVIALVPVLSGGGLRAPGLTWDLPRLGAALGFALAVVLAAVSLRDRSRRGPAWALGAVALVVACGSLVSSGRRILLDEDDLEAMAWIREQTPPLAVICIQPGSSGIWIPALAGRAVSQPYVPSSLVARPVLNPGRGCSHAFRSRSDHPGTGGKLLFRKGDSEIVALSP
jgi:hypothetical protein